MAITKQQYHSGIWVRYDDDRQEFAITPTCECDVCGSWVRRLHCVEAYGIETYACDACTGSELEEDE